LIAGLLATALRAIGAAGTTSRAAHEALGHFR
jgi:hypothetical protein